MAEIGSIQWFKENSLAIGSRSLEGVEAREDSDYDFVLHGNMYSVLVKNLGDSTYIAECTGDYPDLDVEVFGEGFVTNSKFTNFEGCIVNCFVFDEQETIDKYIVLQKTMQRLGANVTHLKPRRVKHFAHIQYALGISTNMDIDTDYDLLHAYMFHFRLTL